MTIIAPSVAAITPPPVTYDVMLVEEMAVGLNLAGVKSSNFAVCMAAANSDGSYSEPSPTIRYSGSIADAVALLTTLGAQATNATANAAAASTAAENALAQQIASQANAAYVAGNPVAPLPMNPTTDQQTAYNAAIAAQQTAATAAGAAAVTAAATQIAAAGAAASTATTNQATAAGVLAAAIEALDAAVQAAASAYVNYTSPVGFAAVEVQG
jgi:beta-lactamase class A